MIKPYEAAVNYVAKHYSSAKLTGDEAAAIVLAIAFIYGKEKRIVLDDIEVTMAKRLKFTLG